MGGSARVYPAPAGAGNPLNPARDRDWGLKLFPTNEEFPVNLRKDHYRAENRKKKQKRLRRGERPFSPPEPRPPRGGGRGACPAGTLRPGALDRGDTSIIDTSNALCGPGFLPGPRLTEGRFTYRSGPPGRRGWSVRRGVRSPSVLLNADRLSGEELRRGAPRWVLRPPGRRRWCESLLRGPGDETGRRRRPPGPPPGRRTSRFPARPPTLERRPPSLPAARPQFRRDDPLNLSILLSGGKETNKDSLSSGERRGKSPAPNPRPGLGGEGNVAYGRPLRPARARGPKSF
ncbi:hypothetical protein Q8A67_013304 [Cirrhinus molitorella]|uniref:Uncharacterized protein n=1 Tax=Cirrhinus molitorella TaxID=172907 RepID=A0AA88TID3_9TELE|nr:hypothetical protein Q8A67_016858 [Cirrhinus molitorella]KAK2890661.1 hypothetical protein Q8A67_013304 [Cirrhinus molitorella]